MLIVKNTFFCPHYSAKDNYFRPETAQMLSQTKYLLQNTFIELPPGKESIVAF